MPEDRLNKGENIAITPEAAQAGPIAVLGSKTTHEFIRYFVASGVAFAVDFSLLWILISIFSVHYLVSGATSFIIGLGIIYFLSVYWVFDTRVVHNKQKELLIFTAIGIVGLGLNEMVLLIFTGWFGFFFLFSKIVSLGVVFLWNFTIRKKLLFSKYE